MQITLTTHDNKKHTMHAPNANSSYVESRNDARCNHCGAPLRAARLRSLLRSTESQDTYHMDASCASALCGEFIGVLRVEFSGTKKETPERSEGS